MLSRTCCLVSVSPLNVFKMEKKTNELNNENCSFQISKNEIKFIFGACFLINCYDKKSVTPVTDCPFQARTVNFKLDCSF